MNKHGWQLINPEKAHWQIKTTKDLSSFLRAVPLIAPPSGIIYFESGSPDEEIESFFRAYGIDGGVIPMGSYDPNPFYHLPISTDKLEELAQIAERHCEVEIAAHIHIYCSNKLILQWYDAFWDPIVVSKEIPEETVKRFCDQLSLPYEAMENV